MQMFERLSQNLDIWTAIGLIGQGLFMSRFLVQWIASERSGRSVVPVAFWYLSIAGGLTLLFYALIRQDPVFILGQLLGCMIYIRNLMLIHRAKATATNGPA